ncbi:hypothetical protein NEIELOOT_01937 [Neisseria elongata subsp. glycolytica ATCC 29315]|uniref:Uncharacterized protein n=1 Tax=Neisseria elongata subsp. glycolytica ATCC 29315 TaxID=546263 RepID=D4DS93_NEIEG|nr:hypothetical protein NEIELOOT_01937 [Neisseria elongata subsp. glycolytica ATCC 29315]
MRTLTIQEVTKITQGVAGHPALATSPVHFQFTFHWYGLNMSPKIHCVEI